MSTFFDSYEFHRNGVGGEPFYVVEFHHLDAGVGFKQSCLTAIVPVSTVEKFEAKKSGWWERVFVIERTNGTTKWRGDNLGEELVPYLAKRLRDELRTEAETNARD